LIPVSPGIDAIMGAERYIEVSNEIAARGNKPIEIFGILVNLYEQRTVISNEIDNVARQKWGSKVFKTRIRKNVSIGEARIQNKTIFEYAPRSNGAKDFTALTAEVLNVN
jgi:chromosome partitioning protein